MKNKRLLEIAERQANKGIPKPRKKLIPSKLVQILKRDENGKPIIELTSMEDIVVNTPTIEGCRDLMRVYECGGWRWHNWKLPTDWNYWDLHKEETCVSAEERFGWSSKTMCLNDGYNIISPQEFYNEQKVTSEMLKEINNWFNEND